MKSLKVSDNLKSVYALFKRKKGQRFPKWIGDIRASIQCRSASFEYPEKNVMIISYELSFSAN